MDKQNGISWPGWETVRRIGSGSFGTVYEIQRDIYGDIEKGALKVITIPHNEEEIDYLRCAGLNDASISGTFRQQVGDIAKEYKLMAQLRENPNIVRCDDFRDVPREDGLGWDIYIKMELLTPLMKCLDRVATEEQIIHMGMDICNALMECQKKNIIHRDIKPQNVFVSESGHFKLGDFGIARTMERTTHATVGIGTYSYMAPEVERNAPYGKTADIYSLGLMMYWLLNERRGPFMPLPPQVPKYGDEEQARQRRFSGEPIPRPKNGSLKLKAIVLRACKFNPEERYESAEALYAALAALTPGAAPIPKAREDALTEEEATMVSAAWAPPARPSYEDETIVSRTVAMAPGNPGAPKGKVKKEKKAKAPKPAKAETYRMSFAPKKKKKSGKYLWIALIVVLLMLGAWWKFSGGELPALMGGTAPTEESTAPGVTETTAATEGTEPPATEETAGTVPAETTAPTEPSQAAPVELKWSGWSDTLPKGVNTDAYEIEKRTLYRSRTLETTSSTEKSTMAGWEMFQTVEANGEFGPWSDWSTTQVTASATREVEKETRYRYRDKETTTGSSSGKEGWTLYDTTYTWSDYGAWSGWTTGAVSQSDSRQVETKTQYASRTKQYTTSTSASMSGWTQYDTTVSYGEWSGWSTTPISSTATRQVEIQDFQTGKRYYVAHYCTGKTGDSDQYRSGNYKYSDKCSYHELGWFDSLDAFVIDGSLVVYYPNGTKYKCSNTCYNFYIMDTQYLYETRYRSRSISTTYHYYQWGNWSSYGDSYIAGSSDTEVSTRTMYRYRDRQSIPTYYFWRWGNWSDWSTKQVGATNDRQTENQVFYRYREQAKVTTYYFRRWTDWTTYSQNPVYPSETVEVQTQTQYRYKPKAN